MAVNVEKHIAHWRSGAEEDFAVAKATVASGHLRHGLFWAHLALEKMLEAHVTKTTGTVPPKSHNLPRLAEIARLDVTEERVEFLKRLNAYQLEGRYPEVRDEVPLTEERAASLMSLATETLEWLKSQL